VVDKGNPFEPVLSQNTKGISLPEYWECEELSMPTMSNELVNAMKYYVPTSRVKLLIRMSKPRIDVRASGELSEETGLVPKIIANLPRTLVHQHALAGQSHTELSDLVQDRSMGFGFPGWYEKKFAKELKTTWLGADAKRLYDYCSENDLRPGFGRVQFYGRYHAKATFFMIRWQREHLNRLLDIARHPLFDQYGRFIYNDVIIDKPLGVERDQADLGDLVARAARVAQAKREAAQARWDQYQKDFNEESDEVAKLYIPHAVEEMRKAADRGQKEAIIFSPSGGDLITDSIWSFVEEHTRVTLSDYQVFHNPNCWDGAAARGLCRWAASKGFKYRIDKWSRDSAYIWVSLQPKSAA
jgi:hypothetical protein